ncbi:MAG: phenylalanine--tRNA ligase subunit alpha [Candidatus Woykebacteria bacterium RIFCSPHIGHO2_12_FULL_43_10]|uniref:Phenylalanine--tRNA ligase alpha subunit n=2 Tax=Candidatus Woykeibacteriota TaxID=1817899 RepID=A0A1G1WX98_9BACT|nr:MAG: phenylalanine--tRNA ligase subunit alpha [Candidatus Woykebacteria bacterium RIFCSPHIGHO2_02_FULL_43_16b]OGY28650.1 MAG: phenylalanine--tRNA ligase subunit alpha [Candidatus Woykebacteria bacterium RIFCSPHIGHO2_01_FULL_43_29]OGY28787.1 MAG: phenylalanine--tRNA ligase subunit alpha [Candidatus Woykebacteria bacterium RIFCSPHIGHO2_12_FULL_43_10]OGY32191.1 MAG: phenylalanine--tRNA ligase subunit alpha [Candidatus Woykebacteria bacterium RIFCSPLOWO2_01_FULL_43_14]
MQSEIDKTSQKFESEIEKIHNLEDLENLRILYIGRKKGILNSLFDKLKTLPNQEKVVLGPLLNTLKNTIESKLKAKLNSLSAISGNKKIDISAPGKNSQLGYLNPLTIVLEDMKDIFHHLGFTFVDGPEVESDVYNFQKLRLHKDHPARDAQQTYYLDEDILLRTHTSSMQIRYMENNAPPIRIISPGRVFRRDQIDATHLPSFMQFEGLLVDKETTLGELIGTIKYFIRECFGRDIQVRVYGHHFPYTEPSIEVEMFHPKLNKWVEMGGAGIVHPEVLSGVGINPDEYHGWAFGFGWERLAMLKYGIDDIRLFYQGDKRFLEQF